MKKSVVKATSMVLMLTIFAKIIGFIKSVLQASLFGATIETDAFNMASGVAVNIFYMLATAISASYLPIYLKRKQNSAQKELRVFANRTISFLFLTSVTLVVTMFVFAPYIMRIFAPTYTGKVLDTTVQYFQVLITGYIVALCCNVYVVILNAEKKYGITSITSVLNSLVLITVMILFTERLGVWALVICVPISYFVQFLVLFCIGRKYARIKFSDGLWDSDLGDVCKNSVPVLISQATVEINQVVDRALLTTVSDGAVTSVSYAAVLSSFVTAIIRAPIDTIFYTEVSDAVAKKEEELVRKGVHNSIKVIFICCIPIVVIVWFQCEHVVGIVYGHGNFAEKAIATAGVALRFYMFCLIPNVVNDVLNRVFYAYSDTRIPMRVGVVEVILNISLSIILCPYFGVGGIVGATAIAELFGVMLRYSMFNVKHYKIMELNLMKEYWKIGVATACMWVVMFGVTGYCWGNILIDFVTKSLFSGCVFIGCLLVMREKILFELLHVLKRKG